MTIVIDRLAVRALRAIAKGAETARELAADTDTTIARAGAVLTRLAGEGLVEQNGTFWSSNKEFARWRITEAGKRANG